MTRLTFAAIALLGFMPLAYAGEFAKQQDYPTGPEFVLGMVVADFNGDGNPDVATANLREFAGGEVSVLLGNGNGTLQTHHDFSVARNNPYWIASGDFNHDGKMDLALALDNYVSSVGVILGDGQGGFSAIVTYPTEAGTIFVAVADVNRDGNQDLIVANNGADSVSVLFGNGDGTFQAQSTYKTGKEPHSIAVADLNGDGILDLAVANQNSTTTGTFSVLLGNGDGTFQPMVAFGTNGLTPNSITAGDFNNDGSMDLAFTNSNSNNIGISIGNGDGTFQPAQTFAAGKFPQAIVSADLNGDGNLDLGVANYKANSVSVYLGSGDGTFQSRTDYLTRGSTAIAARDLNRDSKRDLILAGGDTVSVLLNIGTN